MLRLLMVCLLLTTLLPVTAIGAPKARPQSGIGLLTVRVGVSLDRKAPVLQLYREPKLGRLGERSADRLPTLAPAAMPVDGEWSAIVTGSRPGWVRIIYDEAEREGWVETGRSMEFRRWGEFLDGRPIALLPGLRKEFYLLRSAAALSAAPGKAVDKARPLVAGEVDGDWVHVRGGDDLSGWLRWRDENDRLTILLNPKSVP